MRRSVPSLSLLALGFYAVVFCLALLLDWWRLGAPGGLLRTPIDGVSLALGAGLGVLLAFGSRILVRWSWGRRLMIELSSALRHCTPRDVVVVAGSSGLAEEALFRGVLQPWFGVVPAALVFGLVHIPVTSGLRPWPVFAFIVGVLFGLLTSITGTWYSAGIAHVVVNYLNLHWLLENEAFHASSRSKDDTGLS